MASSVNEIWWTACPVPSATNIAVDQGWLEKEFKKDGIKISHISSLPYTDRLSHFTLAFPRLIRDGGCIPSIWTRSEGARTKVIGTVCSKASQAILVRKDDPITSIEQLKGKRIAVARNLLSLIDFRRATVKRGILMALKANGITSDDIYLVDLPSNPEYADRPYGPDRTGAPDHPSSKDTARRTAQQVELEALENDEVDAVFSYLGREHVIEQKGIAKVIYQLNGHPDWRVLVHNAYPVLCVVHEDFADAYPDLVKRWMKVLVQSGKWAKENYQESLRIISQATGIAQSGIKQTHPDDFHEHLVPEITDHSIEAIEIEKDFLKEHGFITNDFNVKDWIDRRFLDEAMTDIP